LARVTGAKVVHERFDSIRSTDLPQRVGNHPTMIRGQDLREFRHIVLGPVTPSIQQQVGKLPGPRVSADSTPQ